MFFSICIPVYNRKDTILRTLKSIINQSFESFEVLIVDDGSNDGTGKVIQKFMKEVNDSRFHYYYKVNGGKHTALNVAIKTPQGDFFIILDSDDWLVDGALKVLHKYCQSVMGKDEFCGIMGRSMNNVTQEMIGYAFDLRKPVSSYFDYHFILPQKMYVQDCCEAIKTRILKKYKFLEQAGMYFVPEAFVFDQIGINYKLLLTNEIFQIKEYREDGMTLDPNFKKKNVCGYLYHYISRINNVVLKKKMSFSLKIKLEILSWCVIGNV